MLIDGFADRFSQPHRHRVANHSANGFEAISFSGFHEFVVCGERLEDGTFAEGDGAVLLGVAEASVAEAKELRGDGGRRFVGLHAAIDAGVGLTGFLFVTLRDEAGRPVAPSPTGFGVANTLEVGGGKTAAPVERIVRIGVASIKSRQAADDVGDCK